MIFSKLNKGSGKARAVALTLSNICVFCLLFSLALTRNGQLLGYKVAGHTSKTDSTIYINGHGQTEINTTGIGEDITGYGGPVPLKIYISDNKVDSVVALPNSETPAFFAKLVAAGLDRSWDGISVDEAKTMKVDAVSGATFSSNAFIGNVRAGLSALPDTHAIAAYDNEKLSIKSICLLIVLLCGAVLPFFVKGKIYRTIQQLLNVAVLGFWGGTFIDYAILLNVIGNGIAMSFSAAITIVLLIVGFIYPLFGKHNHYCSWVCPFGSLQDLAGGCVRKKVRIGAKTLKWLDIFRQSLWVTLMVLLFIGWGSQWIDYEIFTMFMVQTASVAVLSVGIAFVALSLFIRRPFCRFVCPVGTMLKKL